MLYVAGGLMVEHPLTSPFVDSVVGPFYPSFWPLFLLLAAPSIR